MDAETRKQIEGKANELQIAWQDELLRWLPLRGALERAKREAYTAEMDSGIDYLNPAARQRYLEAAARAYEIGTLEQEARAKYEQVYADLLNAFYIPFMDDITADSIPSEQQMAVARVLYGDD